MRKVIIIVFVFVPMIVFGQEKSTTKKSAITSLELSLSSKEELKNIKWNNIKGMFKDNAQNDSISLSFEVQEKKSKKINFKHSFKVQGVSKDIDELILLSKKRIKVLNEIKS